MAAGTGFLRETWKNFAARLWDSELVTKLNEHQDLFDDQEPPQLLSPSPDPHQQYFHLIEDTAWAGMNKTSGGAAIAPGDTIAGWNSNLFNDYGLTSNLTNGTILINIADAGGYLFGLYWTFQAVSNGGAFQFEVLADGAPTGLAQVADLSNQSDIGSGSIAGFFPVDASQAPVLLSVRLTASSTKNIAILGMTLTLSRLFPLVGTIGSELGQIMGPTGPTEPVTIPPQTPTFDLVENDTPVQLNTIADAAIPTNWVTYQTIDIDPALDKGVYEVLNTVKWNMSVTNRAALLRMVINGVAQPTFQLEASDVLDTLNHVSVGYFISDGVTPHTIQLQGLVRGPGAGPVLTVLSTRTRTFIEDSV